MYLINRLVTRVQQYLKAIHCKLFFFFFSFFVFTDIFSRLDETAIKVKNESSSSLWYPPVHLDPAVAIWILKKKRSKKTSSHILMKETSTGTAVENTRKLQLIVSSPPTHFFRVSNMVKVFLYPFYWYESTQIPMYPYVLSIFHQSSTPNFFFFIFLFTCRYLGKENEKKKSGPT